MLFVVCMCKRESIYGKKRKGKENSTIGFLLCSCPSLKEQRERRRDSFGERTLREACIPLEEEKLFPNPKGQQDLANY